MKRAKWIRPIENIWGEETKRVKYNLGKRLGLKNQRRKKMGT